MKPVRGLLVLLALVVGYPGAKAGLKGDGRSITPESKAKVAGDKPPAAQSKSELLKPKRFTVQILSAIYGTGGKNADVTAKVRSGWKSFSRNFHPIHEIWEPTQTRRGTRTSGSFT
jgi:hypothetical protein